MADLKEKAKDKIWKSMDYALNHADMSIMEVIKYLEEIGCYKVIK